MAEKILHISQAKGKNKRIEVILYDDGRGEKVFRVFTKTLKDFKKREILITDNAYSVETFAVLSELFHSFINSHEIKNKVLLKELSNLNKFTGKYTFE